MLLKDFGIGAGNDVVEDKGSSQRPARESNSPTPALSPDRELAVAAEFCDQARMAYLWSAVAQGLRTNRDKLRQRDGGAAIVRVSQSRPPIKFVALGETLPAYTGDFKAIGKVLLHKKLPAGEHKLAGELKFRNAMIRSAKCRRPCASQYRSASRRLTNNSGDE